MISYLRKALGDTAGLLRICGPTVTLFWIARVFLHLPTVLRTRTLEVADAAMGRGPFEIRYRGLRFKVTGARVFSGIREMYVRDVYLQGGWLTVPPDAIVVDLGANVGNFTNLALAHHPTVRVVAVEPSQCLRTDFLANVRLNGGEHRVRLVRAFLGGRTAKQISCESDPCYAGAAHLAEDEFLRILEGRVIDFLKCDIEGSEFDLLTRASKLLSITQRLAIEVHAFAGDVSSFIDMLREAGFVIGPIKQDPDGSCTLLAKRGAATA